MMHSPTSFGGLAGGYGGVGGDGSGDGGNTTGGDAIGEGVGARGPQSVQSVPRSHMAYSLPRPPSSQSPSEATRHVLEHVGSDTGEGGGGRLVGGAMGEKATGGGDEFGFGSVGRLPQSTQSVPRSHEANSAPAPPSSQSPSAECRHVLVQSPGEGGGDGGTGGAPGGGFGATQVVSRAMISPPRRKRLGVPVGQMPGMDAIPGPIALGVDMQTRKSETSEARIVGCTVSSCATTPATCGQAIDVPDLRPVAVVESGNAASTAEPGPRMSTQLP